MYLSRICVKNFRNFRCLEVELGPKCVVVGENNVGKTNLLFALRLILDPRLSDISRHLREEDFWDGLNEPAKRGEIIEISIEIRDFQDDINVLAVLQEHCILGPSPDTALLTYRFRPKPGIPRDREISIRDYEYHIFGGGLEENKVDHSVRRWIPVEVLPALRDAERDLASWRQSPLRPLVENLNIPDATLRRVASGIDTATDELLDEDDVKQLIQGFRSRLSLMVGSAHDIDPSLGFAPTTPERLTRALRMFGDGRKKRPVGEMSLGIDNLLYLLLLAIELEHKETAGERAKTILAIEEPESHLHPHLQRLVFRDFLHRDPPIFLTTHSPYIASVAPLKSLVLLRNDEQGFGSVAKSTLQAGLTGQEIADLQRYLDATRAEMLFARGVILVEGTSELFLIPAVAENMNRTLDKYGITVCSVLGTNFVPYAKLLGAQGLNVPFIILTDGDPYTTNNGEKRSRGLSRAISVAETVGRHDPVTLEEMHKQGCWAELREITKDIGVFVGKRTLEVDLVDRGHGQEILDTLRELRAPKARVDEIQRFVEQGEDLDETEADYLMRTIRRIGKGGVAQRLAGRVDHAKFPTYVTEGIRNITEALSI